LLPARRGRGSASAFQELTPNGAGPLKTLPKPEIKDESSANTQAQGSMEHLVQTLRRENARFRAAQEFSRRVTLERSLDAMLERILDVLFELVPAETAAIALVSGKETIKVRRADLVADVPQSILKQALEADRGLLVNNALIDQRFGRSESVMIRGIKSVMAVPLKARDRTLGVLYVDSVSQSAAFGEDDLPLLESIASQAAMFLDNANLIAEVASEVEKRANLSRFLSPAAVEEVLSGRTDLKLDGQSALVTVLFADIRGFTGITANMPPEDVVRFLNRFFSEMVDAVESTGGVVDKFIGDAVMALWGAPHPKVDDARSALKGAITMMQRATGIHVAGRPLELGIGVHTGNAVLGSIGSKRRLDYTAIGSTVNMASRLCSLAQAGEVLTLQDTLQLAGPQVRAEATKATTVKGYDQPVVPYIVRAVEALVVTPAAAFSNRETALNLPRIPARSSQPPTWPGGPPPEPKE
jgi:adenylate cyclase